MIYLIDTQILIWSLGLSDKIPNKIRNILNDTNNFIFVSSASIWEIAIKTSIGKLIFPFKLKDIRKVIQGMNINILDIRTEHIIKVSDLPFHHKDPFDRLIISQAIVENLIVISSDKNFSKYKINNIW